MTEKVKTVSITVPSKTEVMTDILYGHETKVRTIKAFVADTYTTGIFFIVNIDNERYIYTPLVSFNQLCRTFEWLYELKIGETCKIGIYNDTASQVVINLGVKYDEKE